MDLIMEKYAKNFIKKILHTSKAKNNGRKNTKSVTKFYNTAINQLVENGIVHFSSDYYYAIDFFKKFDWLLLSNNGFGVSSVSLDFEKFIKSSDFNRIKEELNEFFKKKYERLSKTISNLQNEVLRRQSEEYINTQCLKNILTEYYKLEKSDFLIIEEIIKNGDVIISDNLALFGILRNLPFVSVCKKDNYIGVSSLHINMDDFLNSHLYLSARTKVLIANEKRINELQLEIDRIKSITKNNMFINNQ